MVLRSVILGSVATGGTLLVPATASAATVEHAPLAAASCDDGISPWWWLALLLLAPLLVLLLAWFRGRDSYDYASYSPAQGPGFPEVTPDREARIRALADGTESSAAAAIARARAAQEAAKNPPKPGARVPSEGGAVPLPIGASRPLPDPDRAPDGYPIKADTTSGLYYLPDHPGYAAAHADLWFATAPTAESGGFRPAD